jgi:hypothetical protein
MTSVLTRGLVVAAIACVATSMSACSTLNRLPPDQRYAAQRDADSVLQKISHTNSNLTSFKGIGRIHLRDAGQPNLSERVVWIGSLPDKLALVVLVAGRPVVKVAADGHHLYAVDLQDPKGSYRKIRTSDPRLDRLIRIPATVGDIATVLSGRTPIREHSRAFIQRAESSEEVILVLENWWSVVQKVYLNVDRQTVLRFEIFGTNGTLLYRGEIAETQVVQGYRVPLRLRFSTDTGTALQLDIERYMVDVPITPAMFTLQPPDATAP